MPNYGVYKAYTLLPLYKKDLLDDMNRGINDWLDQNKDSLAYLGDFGYGSKSSKKVTI